MSKKKKTKPIEHVAQELQEIPLTEFIALLGLIDDKEQVTVRVRCVGDNWGRPVLYVKCIGDHT